MEAFTELSARGVESRLYLGGIGHPPAVGDGPEIDRLYLQVLQWFDRHMKGKPPARTPLVTGSKFEIANAGYFNSAWDGTVRYADTIGTAGRTYYFRATSANGGTLTTSPPPALLTPPLAMVNTYAGAGYLDESVTREYLLQLGVPVINPSQARACSPSKPDRSRPPT